MRSKKCQDIKTNRLQRIITTMKKILVCTDGSPFAENSYHYAAWFATRLSAEVDVLCVTDISPSARSFDGQPERQHWLGCFGSVAQSVG
jgi:hypothetical protein